MRVLCGFILYIPLICLCSKALIDELPELSDGDEEADDEDQWMEDGDSPQVRCLFCDRCDSAAHNTPNSVEDRPVSHELLSHCYVDENYC